MLFRSHFSHPCRPSSKLGAVGSHISGTWRPSQREHAYCMLLCLSWSGPGQERSLFCSTWFCIGVLCGGNPCEHDLSHQSTNRPGESTPPVPTVSSFLIQSRTFLLRGGSAKHCLKKNEDVSTQTVPTEHVIAESLQGSSETRYLTVNHMYFLPAGDSNGVCGVIFVVLGGSDG